MNNVQEFMSNGRELVCEKLLPEIVEQASKADSTRSLDPAIIQAMPLHINAHPDRVAELVGRFLLGVNADW